MSGWAAFVRIFKSWWTLGEAAWAVFWLSADVRGVLPETFAATVNAWPWQGRALILVSGIFVTVCWRGARQIARLTAPDVVDLAIGRLRETPVKIGRYQGTLADVFLDISDELTSGIHEQHLIEWFAVWFRAHLTENDAGIIMARLGKIDVVEVRDAPVQLPDPPPPGELRSKIQRYYLKQPLGGNVAFRLNEMRDNEPARPTPEQCHPKLAEAEWLVARGKAHIAALSKCTTKTDFWKAYGRATSWLTDVGGFYVVSEHAHAQQIFNDMHRRDWQTRGFKSLESMQMRYARGVLRDIQETANTLS